MTSNFPASLDNLSNPLPGDQVSVVSHSSQHTNINDIIEALEAKLGIGAGGPGTTPGILRRTGNGISQWGPLVNADVDTAAAIALSKLAAGSSGLLKSNGSVISAGNQIAATDIPAQIITGGSVGAGMHIGYRQVQGGSAGGNANIAPGSIIGSDLVNGTITATQLGSTAVGRALSVYDASAASVGGSGTWSYMGPQVGVTGLVPGRSRCMVFLIGSTYNNAAGAVMQLGIGVDSTNPSTSSYIHTAIAGYGLQHAVAYGMTASSTGHSFYAVWNTNTNTMTRLSTTWLIVIVINE